MQKQQIEIELVEVGRALEELNKADAENMIFKTAGPLLIKTNKDDIIKELEEKKELANTRTMVLSKQETRLKESLKEVQGKIDEMVRNNSGPSAGVGLASKKPKGE